MSSCRFPRLSTGDHSLRRVQEDGARPLSLVLVGQFRRAVDEGALRFVQWNAQVVVLTVFRLFAWSAHAVILAKKKRCASTTDL